MEKDLKRDILDIAKMEGLDLAEDMAVSAVKAAFTLVSILVTRYSKDYGVIIGPLLNTIEPIILKAIDKIDGEDDPGY